VFKGLRSVCGELLVELQHVGSTAAPDLSAKPIFDIAAAVATLDSLPELIRRLTIAGYLCRGDQKDAEGHLFVVEPSPDVLTIHLRDVEHDGVQWRNYVRFLAASACDSYTAFKAAFIREILDTQRS